MGNFSQNFINVSPAFTGAMIFQSEHTTQNKGMDVCFWDKENQKMLFCINDITSRATTIRDSFQIVGSTTLDNENFTLCAGANFIDCNTTLTGADLFVDDDIEAQSIFANGNMEVVGSLTIDTNTLFVNGINNRVGIRTTSPTTTLEVVGDNPGNVGGFPSGALQVRSPLTGFNNNAVITGHNSFSDNKQLWYLGSTSSSNDNIAFINRQNAELHFHTNDINRLTIQADGDVGIGETNPSEKLEVGGNTIINGFLTANRLNVDNLRLDSSVLSSTDTNGPILIAPDGTGAIIMLTDGLFVQGTSTSATGDGSELIEMRDNRITNTSAVNYVLSISRQNSGTAAWYLGNDGNADAILATNNRDIRIGKDVSGTFTEHMRIEVGGDVGIGLTNPTEKLEINGNIKLGTVFDKTAYAQLSSSADQTPTNTSPTVITYNTQDALTGINHSTTINPGEITIDIAGIYFVSPQPQVGKDTGAAKTDFDMFLQVNRGSGFVDEPNSNIKLTIKDSDITDVIVSAFTISLSVGVVVGRCHRKISWVI